MGGNFQNAPGTDAENLGNGVLVAYIVITTVLLIAYVIDGRYNIQSFFLENKYGRCKSRQNEMTNFPRI